MNQEYLNKFEVLKISPTKENPFIVESYPYGFKRTKALYYVESNNKGDRLVFQTLNPTTQKWNAEKKGVYSPVLIVGIEKETGYFNVILSLSTYSDEEFKNDYEMIKNLVEFNDFQKEKIKDLMAFHKIMKNVSFSCEVRKFRHKITGEIVEQVPIFELKDYEEVGNEQGQKENEQKKIIQDINKAVYLERQKLNEVTI